MKTNISYLIFTLFFLAGFYNPATAGNLCEDQCQLTITFPEGGSIEAVESFSITFGEGGFVNDGAVTTGYASGQILNFALGQTLQFTAGGELNLGAAGNIEYTNISVSSTGIFSVVALGGAEIINIYALTLTDVTLDLSANSNLVIHASGSLFLNQPQNPVTGGTGTGAVIGSGTLTLNSGSGAVSINSGSVVDGVLQGSNLSLTSDSNGGISINEIDPQLPIVIQSPLDDLISLQGLTIDLQDGASCQVVNEQCITDSGTIYVLKDGALTLSDETGSNVSSGSSGFDPWLVLFSSLLLIARRRLTLA